MDWFWTQVRKINPIILLCLYHSYHHHILDLTPVSFYFVWFISFSA